MPAQKTAPLRANMAGDRFKDEEAKRAMFTRLVNGIRAYHLFSSAWPAESWEAELPALEREVMAAEDRPELLIALNRVSTSLRNGHLSFTPVNGWDNPGIAVLPITFFQTGNPRAPRFFVQQADAETALLPGDEMVRYAGVESGDLLEHFRHSNVGASSEERAQRLTDLLQWRHTHLNPGIVGSTVELSVRRAGRVITTSAVFAPNGDPPISTDSKPACAAPPREYSGYELVRANEHLCLYKGLTAELARYPIVRQKSFFYLRDGHSGIGYDRIRDDREMVRKFLAETPSLAGVLLDLRDNHGGHHPDLFLPWYLPGPFGSSNEWVRLHADLEDRQRLFRALRDWSAVDEYQRRASAGEEWWVRSFRCPASECPTEADGPVTGRPIVLLLGPSCRSACDNFVDVWAMEHAGPIVGAPSAAMLTAIRYPLEVRLGDETLGDFTVALVGTRSSEAEEWHEGLPRAVDHPVERVWPPASYEQAVVRTAISALSKRQPKQLQPLGHR